MKRFRLYVCVLSLALVCGCAETEKKDKAPPPPETLIPKVGTVAVVQIAKDREVNTDNWADVIKRSFKNDQEDQDVNVVRRRWEVTVFYGPGEQEVITVHEDPKVRTGQRVRVTGNKIEPIGR